LVKFLKKHKKIRIIFIIIAAIAAVIMFYGFLIEPKMLIERRFWVDLESGSFAEVGGFACGAAKAEAKCDDSIGAPRRGLEEHQTSETIAEQVYPPGAPARLKIVTIADLHIGYGTPISYVNKLVEEINAESPDLILFTGDLKTRTTYLERHSEEAVAALSNLSAKYGKFAVYGNHDTFPAFADIMEESGFTLLTNSGRTLDVGGEKVFLGGINSLSLSPQIDKTLRSYEDPDITIILAHEPDLSAEFNGRTENALILSGHIHGGQIDIPILTRWFITSGGKGNLFVDGFYKSGDNTVFVSTGIGMSAIPMRFRVPPQFEVIYIR
jgi:predicted MPP superfamily phosphohydrolase